MSKIDDVRAAMVEAMKAKDKDRKDSLSMLLSALKNKAIDKRADLTAQEENEIILKEIKQTKETRELAPQDREDIITECTNRIKVYEEFAPRMLGEEEIRQKIAEVLQDLQITQPVPSDKGKIMKQLMPKVKGIADGTLVNQILGQILAGA
ncbi:MAG: GatB/YqeY domain-containing protein [Lachnospiraceae bacterium]